MKKLKFWKKENEKLTLYEDNNKFTSYEKYLNFLFKFNDIMKEVLEDKYPHKCYVCKEELNIKDFFLANMDITTLNLVRLWINKNIKLYCCHCYGIMKKIPQEAITEELLLDKEITNLEYIIIQIDPDGESVFSNSYADENSNKVSTITLFSYPNGKDVTNYVDINDIYVPITDNKIDIVFDSPNEKRERKGMKNEKNRQRISRCFKSIGSLFRRRVL